MTTEHQSDEPQPQDAEDEQSPQEFAEEVENDPAYNPDDEDLQRVKGG